MKDSLAQWATDTMHLYRLANENPGLSDPPPEAQVLIQAMKDRFARYSDEEMLHMFLDLLGIVEDRSGADKASEFVQIAHGVMNEQYRRQEAELLERIQNRLGVENIRIIRL